MSGSGQHQEPRPDEGEEVPERVLERAKAAFAQRASGPIANLVSDSLDTGDSPESHVVTFESPTARIELRVSAARSESKLAGTITGMAAERSMLHLEGSELALVAGVDGGDFKFDPVSHGVVRLSFEDRQGATLVTDWFQI